jgi:hypothetical protein
MCKLDPQAPGRQWATDAESLEREMSGALRGTRPLLNR